MFQLSKSAQEAKIDVAPEHQPVGNYSISRILEMDPFPNSPSTSSLQQNNEPGDFYRVATSPCFSSKVKLVVLKLVGKNNNILSTR